ncbi:hypothetical protein BJX68DRAFT_242344 [Aspergillus pseudodeflectus]|uniref:Extracellular membrane protein CFEM domain-containing protein n=1 Tax=Aspergillus pseudodeflectus TaxID=176178 RepID=A0ABR4JYI4_9EURO
MILSTVYLVLLIAGANGLHSRALRTVSTEPNGADQSLTPLNNRNGWVNPEDLPPMPQCIAQQDRGVWLSTMTGCTAKRCTNHFAIICTHHQWLTQLSCLSTAFSPDVIRSYYSYCDRSILAKAQLYQWVRGITGRPWLVDVGDTNELPDLSPASLTRGYAGPDVIDKAPTCLTGSGSALSMEPFQHVMASCGFTSTTHHTGNAARPWEYNEHFRSMVALDSETASYDFVRRYIADGNYFDKKCFCSSFTLNVANEPCSGGAALDLTKERLWMNAICGSASLPKNWKDGLKITQFAYIPVEAWHWPMCFADMPKQVIDLTDQCATDACEVDSSGYCNVRRAVDRACFCNSISYDSCKGSCQVFENRIDYVQWLHGLCGKVADWHGLPENWRKLAVPTPTDMIPWKWTVQPSNDSNISNVGQSKLLDPQEGCPWNEWTLGSIAIVNMATILTAMLVRIRGKNRTIAGDLRISQPWSWFSKGVLIAALQLLVNGVNSLLVQNTPGYEDVPAIQLMLLWCSLPRLLWPIILLLSLQPLGAREVSPAASLFFAETILQTLSSYYILMTVNYGREHGFYFGRLSTAVMGTYATAMYAGALLWLVVVGPALVQLMRAMRRMNRLANSGGADPSCSQTSQATTSEISDEVVALLHERWTKMNGDLQPLDTLRDFEEALLASSRRGHTIAYGTFSSQKDTRSSPETFLYAGTVITMLLLWIAQWFFWGGFLGLSAEEFCPPRLGILTAFWLASSVIGIVISSL